MQLEAVLPYALLVFTSFFTLVNPISILPVYLGLTSELEEKQKLEIARRAVFAALVILLGFAFSGQFLFKFFSISVDSFRIVGGESCSEDILRSIELSKRYLNNFIY